MEFRTGIITHTHRIPIIAALLFFGLQLSALAAASEPMLPRVYRQQIDISGWLMSEKLDGVRGRWDGHQLRSKHGQLLHPPQAFLQGWPPFPLEGEIWGGRGTFEQTVGIVRRQHPDEEWLRLKFAIFDVPQATGGFTSRMARAQAWFATHRAPCAFIIPQRQVANQEQLQQELTRIDRAGGEGLIVRQPQALYRAGRSAEILKVKSYQDAEARVIAHIPGKGRNRGRLGALLVQLETGTQFKIGSGFSDAERSSPPPVGSLITFKFYGRYASGIPKFPSFLRIRSDQGL